MTSGAAMQSLISTPSFRPLVTADFPMLHDWLNRPHVAEWWDGLLSFAEVESDFLELADPESTERGYIALLSGEPIGFIQSYVVIGSDEGWWEDETDPGARGIDQFLANAEQLGKGLGARMVRAFVDQLFQDPVVTKVQADPSPENERAIGCYLKAGFSRKGEVITPDGSALLMVRERSSDEMPNRQAKS
jgi:RimJ/RimL family protein N-acetyltransferase